MQPFHVKLGLCGRNGYAMPLGARTKGYIATSILWMAAILLLVTTISTYGLWPL